LRGHEWDVVELLENERHPRDRLLGVLGWQSVESLWDGGLNVPESRVVAIVEGATLRDLDGCLNSAFLDISRQVAAPASQALDTQLIVLPTLPVLALGGKPGLLGRFVGKKQTL
jgi:hypothetical protein